MKTADLTKRVDQLLEQAATVLSSQHYAQSHSVPMVNKDAFRGFRTAVLSFIQRVYGTAHPHYDEFEKSVNYHHVSDTQVGIAILK